MDTDWCRTDAQTCSGCMTKLLIVAAIVRAARLAELAGPSFRVNSPRVGELPNGTARCHTGLEH
jgi:hypothetical protein